MSRSLEPQDSSPLHLVISEGLREKILSGEYASGTRIPSEHQLMEQYQVSRITVRQAIANLVNQGLVVARRGRGVFVKDQQKFICTLSNPPFSFDENMAQQGVSSSIQNLVFEPLPAPDKIQQVLQLSENNTEIYFQRKLILLDDIPAAVDITYVLPELGRQLADELCIRMTFPTLERHGIAIGRIEATLEATHTNHEMSQYLHVPLGEPLLVYRYIAYTNQDTPILCGETFSRGDRLCYSVVLSRDS
ncbi:MAG: GntR family transcriptional regulator [Leptolyngbyaceae cyanobacterium HOT.MB2.61]|jgi:GntR family transcriptional regulator|nr:GntR family transcriptional regulator [Leptolyngbyaceae cyanobacterium HOT.MB2.61]